MLGPKVKTCLLPMSYWQNKFPVYLDTYHSAYTQTHNHFLQVQVYKEQVGVTSVMRTHLWWTIYIKNFWKAIVRPEEIKVYRFCSLHINCYGSYCIVKAIIKMKLQAQMQWIMWLYNCCFRAAVRHCVQQSSQSSSGVASVLRDLLSRGSHA